VFVAQVVVTDRARPGVVIAPALFWKSLTPDSQGVNHTISQAAADMGGGGTLYDNLVEVEKVAATA